MAESSSLSHSKYRFHAHSHMLLVRNYCNILCTKQFAFGAVQVLYIDVEYLVADGRVIRFVFAYRPPNTDMASSLQLLKALASDIFLFTCNVV